MPCVRSGRAKIYYEVRGKSGPPVILIRGFASTIKSWNGFDADLARDHRTVVLDNRGVGASSAPSGVYTVARMADDVVAVMEAAGLDSAHLLGTSLGGMIAQEVALRHPRRVRSLLLVGSTCGRGGIPLRCRGVLAIALAATLPPALRARVSAVAALSDQARRSRPELIRRRADVFADSPTPLVGLVGQAFAVFTHSTGSRLAHVSAPTLILHGDADNLIDCRNAGVLASLVRTARVELWKGVGHDVAAEAPQRLAFTVRRHIRDVTCRPRAYRQPPLARHDRPEQLGGAHSDLAWSRRGVSDLHPRALPEPL